MTKNQNEKSLLVVKGELPMSYSAKCVDLDANVGIGQEAVSNVTTDRETEEAITHEDPHKGEKEEGFGSLTRKQLVTLALISMGNLCLGVMFYFLTPFYPKVAGTKQMSQTAIGIFFGTTHLTIVVTSPIIGNYLTQLGPRFTCLTGITTGGIVTILFGLLDRCAPGAPFITLSFLCRLLIGLASAACVTSSTSILVNEFPNHACRAFAIAEIANGFGFMVGPAFGGALYQAGGFGLPSYVIGIIILIDATLLYICLPPPKGKIAPRRGSVLTLGRSPLVVLSVMNITGVAIGVTFVETSLANHLEQFKFVTGIVGLIFVVMPGVYACTSTLDGYISDTMNLHHVQFMVATLCSAIAYLFIGPSSLFVGIPTKVWLVVICLALLGIAYGSCLIPALKLMIIGAIEIGFADNLETYGLVSGALYFSICLGGVLGNVVGGILLDVYGYPTTSTIIVFINLAMTVITYVYFFIRNKRIKQRTIACSN